MSSSSLSSDYEIIDKVGDKLRYNKRNCERMLSTIPNDMPIAILSIAGKTRIETHKSMMRKCYYKIDLDGFTAENMQFDRKGSNSFRYAGGKDSITSGLHALCKPFKINHSSSPNEKMAVFLVDSQGLDALDQKGGVDQVLFALTNFLSSHIIYNIGGNIKPNQLLSLTVLANHSVSVDKENLPSLDIIVRDAKYTNTEKLNEMLNFYNQYESEMLSNSDSINDFRRLQDYFRPDSVHCYPFPYPGRNVEKKKFTGDKKDINSAFMSIVHHYFVNTLNPSNLIPKFKNKEELLSIFGSMCDNILKLQKSGTDIFYEMITESHNNRLIYEFKEKYFYPLQDKCYKVESDVFDIEYRKCIQKLEEVMSKCQGGKTSKIPIKERIVNQLYELKGKNIEDQQRKEMLKKEEKELEERKKNLEIMRKDSEAYLESQNSEKKMIELLQTFIAKNKEPPIIKEERDSICPIF